MKKKKRLRVLITIAAVLTAGVAYCLTGGFKEDRAVSYALAEENQPKGAAGSTAEGSKTGSTAEGSTAGGTAGAGLTNGGGVAFAEQQPAKIAVHICGEVNAPGVYEIEAKTRVCDLLLLAGGATGEADADYVNLARFAADGERIYIPSRSETKELSPEQYMQGQERKTTLVNINTAGPEELMTLTGIGSTRANSILKYREENGPFRRIEELMLVNGIKEAAYEQLCGQICTGYETEAEE